MIMSGSKLSGTDWGGVDSNMAGFFPPGPTYFGVTPHQPAEKPWIEVRKTSSKVEVRRTDGKPIRVQIITCAETGRPARTDVFTAKVSALKLARVGP